jgi:hypothetical protein
VIPIMLAYVPGLVIGVLCLTLILTRYRPPSLDPPAGPWPTGDWPPLAAWRHVRTRFRRAGAGNAIWVWNPIAPYEGSAPLRGVFPGAGAVDWVAVDGYD